LPHGEDWQPPAVPGYRYLKQASRRTLGAEGLTLRTAIRDNWKPAIVLAGGDSGEIITGYGPLKTTEQRVPWLLQRRRAQSTAFVWALSLNSDSVKLTASDVQDAQGAAINRAEAVQVELRDAKRQWRVLINPTGKSVVAHSSDREAWPSKATFAVRLRSNQEDRK
jgi:hypothetical protein